MHQYIIHWIKKTRCKLICYSFANIEWRLPKGSWDTHVHVFDPRFKYSASRSYTPETATWEDLRNFNSSLSANDGGMNNIVLVQPSPYGTDNSLVLSLLRAHSHTDVQQACDTTCLLRAIVVIDPAKVTDSELGEMNRLGARGTRINVQASANTSGDTDLTEAIERTASRIAQLPGWLVQLFVAGSQWDG